MSTVTKTIRTTSTKKVGRGTVTTVVVEKTITAIDSGKKRRPLSAVKSATVPISIPVTTGGKKRRDNKPPPYVTI